MKRFIYLIVLSSLIVFAFNNQLKADDLVKLYENQDYKQTINCLNAVNAADWQMFLTQNGAWDISIDKASGSPVVAIGKPIKICPYIISSEQLVAASKDFLYKYKSIFKADINSLKLLRAEESDGKWFVSFVQIYDNKEVIGSEINLVVNNKGEVFSFNISFYDNIKFENKNKIIKNKAVEITNNSLNLKVNSKLTDKIMSSNEIKEFIIPIYKGNLIDYKMVYKINSGFENNLIFETYLDVFSGDIVWQKLSLSNIDKTLILKAEQYEDFYDGQKSEVPLKNNYYTIDNINSKTDETGSFNLKTNADEIIIKYESDETVIYFEDEDYFDSLTCTKIDVSNADDKIVLNEKNADKYALFGLYHLKYGKDQILKVDSKLKCMNIKMPITFYNGYQYRYFGVNAFYNSAAQCFGFTEYKNDTIRLSESPAVMYHEYGHAINDLFYKERNVEFLNKSCHEALADINANMILDDPIATRNVYIKDKSKYIRNSENTYIYPDSLTGESHNDGLVLAGAFWDLRKLIGRDLTYKLSHFARYSLPNDQSTGVAFKKWLIAVLVADDDNGDLTDGSPHYNEIIKAFNMHNIGLNLFVYDALNFTVLEDMENCKGSQNIAVEFSNPSFICQLPDTVKFCYTIDNSKEVNEINLLKNNNTYTNTFKGLEKPGIIKYYLKYKDNNSNYYQYKNYNNSMFRNYVFTCGYKSIYVDEFENENFKFENNISKGAGLMIGKPKGYSAQSSYYIQPDSDLSKNGEKCMLTGTGYDNSPYYMMEGFSSAESPAYLIKKDIKKYLISFWMFEWHLFYGTQILDNNVGVFVVYKTNQKPEWDTLFKMKKYLEEGEEKNDSIMTLHQQRVWKRMIYELPNISDEDTELQLKVIAGSREKYGNSTSTSIVCLLVDDLKIMRENNDGTGIGDQSADGLEVYPNPMIDNGYLSYYTQNEDAVDLELYDIIGQKIGVCSGYKMKIGQNIVPIKEIVNSNLDPGSYIIRISKNNTLLNSIKFIKI